MSFSYWLIHEERCVKLDISLQRSNMYPTFTFEAMVVWVGGTGEFEVLVLG